MFELCGTAIEKKRCDCTEFKKGICMYCDVSVCQHGMDKDGHKHNKKFVQWNE